MKKSVVFILVAVLLMTACAPAFAKPAIQCDYCSGTLTVTCTAWRLTGRTRGGIPFIILPGNIAIPGAPKEYEYQRTVTVTCSNNPSHSFSYTETQWRQDSVIPA